MAAALEFYRFLQQSAPRVQTASLVAAEKRRKKPLPTPQAQDYIAAMLSQIDLIIDPRDKSVADPIAKVGFWEWDLTKGVADIMRPGMTCVDIGANAGYFTALFASLGAGRVLAVEPHPELARRLRASAELNGWSQVEVFEAAILDGPGTTRLCISGDDNLGGASVMGSHAAIMIDDIPVMSMDQLLTEETSVDIIKMDAEGAEPTIWKGMRDTVARYPDIQIFAEAHVNPQLDGWLDAVEDDGFILRYVDTEGWFMPLNRNMLKEQLMWDLFLSRHP